MIGAYDCELFFSQKGVGIETEQRIGKQNNALFSSDVTSHFARGKKKRYAFIEENKQTKGVK